VNLRREGGRYGKQAPLRQSRPALSPLRVEQPAELDRLALPRGRPVLVLVGGAAGVRPEQLELISTVLAECVVPLLEERNAAVVDGGTDSGVMRAIGRARDVAGGRFPLVGVAAEGTVVIPGHLSSPADAVELEPHHTHIVLVPGHSWGDESPWLAQVADVIAGGRPSATLVINGGEITYDDIAQSLVRRRPVLVLAGTGRTADAIAAAAAGQHAEPRAVQVAASPLTRILAVSNRDALCDALRSALEPVSD
jgi:hypothetical protein